MYLDLVFLMVLLSSAIISVGFGASRLGANMWLTAWLRGLFHNLRSIKFLTTRFSFLNASHDSPMLPEATQDRNYVYSVH